MKKPYQKLLVINAGLFIVDALVAMMMLGSMSFIGAMLVIAIGWIRRIFALVALVLTIKTFRKQSKDYFELCAIACFAIQFVGSLAFIGFPSFEGAFVMGIGFAGALMSTFMLVYLFVQMYQRKAMQIVGGSVRG